MAANHLLHITDSQGHVFTLMFSQQYHILETGLNFEIVLLFKVLSAKNFFFIFFRVVGQGG